jgi:RHS repeat-associated protein
VAKHLASGPGAGNLTDRTFGNGTSQTLSWDGLGRLVSVIQRDSANNGYNWTATYDALGRRLRTTHTPVTANVAYPLQTLTIGSLYDPQVEFQELAVTLNPDLRNGTGAQRTWKVFGPDGDGRYGGMLGVGGLEATIRESDGQSTTVINDVFGNVVGTVSGTNGLWNPARVSSYGPEPGYQALTLSASVPLVETLVWRTRRIDPTGYYWLGARYYDPVGGRMLSPDPLGHAASMSLYDLCNGDPLNRFDADGRLGKVAWAYGSGFVQGAVQGLGNEVAGVGKLAYGMTVGLGEQITLTVMDTYSACTDGGDFESAIFRGTYDMSLNGATGGEIATEAVLQASGYRFGNQIYSDLEYGNETGDYSQFSQDMGTVAGIAGGPVVVEAAPARTLADDLAAAATRAQNTVGPGSGAAYGTRVHMAFRNEVRALGTPDVQAEVSFLNGRVVDYGTPGSVRLDAVEFGANGQVLNVFDLKTGSATLTPQRILQIQQQVGSPVPVNLLRP